MQLQRLILIIRSTSHILRRLTEIMVISCRFLVYRFGVSLIAYLYAVKTETQIYMSGNFFYDYLPGQHGCMFKPRTWTHRPQNLD
jgi:hypothetical protein